MSLQLLLELLQGKEIALRQQEGKRCKLRQLLLYWEADPLAEPKYLQFKRLLKNSPTEIHFLTQAKAAHFNRTH